MQDRTPTYPGRVTLTPVSGQANTYDMVRADSPTQEGTPLNKNTLLKDTTAASLGLTGDPTVDEALNVLSKIPQIHVWKRNKTVEGYNEVTGDVRVYVADNDNTSTIVYCEYKTSATAAFNSEKHIMQLTGDIGSASISFANGVSTLQENIGKYLSFQYSYNMSAASEMVGGANNATLNYAYRINGDIRKVSNDTAISNYPYAIVANLTHWEYYSYEVTEIVYSPNENAYPKDGKSGEWEYTYCGQIVHDYVKFATGTYVGTGTNGSGTGDQTVLTFPFRPKLLFIYAGSGTYNMVSSFVYGSQWNMTCDGGTNTHGAQFTWNDKTVSFYSTEHAIYQFNGDGVTYGYVAIG